MPTSRVSLGQTSTAPPVDLDRLGQLIAVGIASFPLDLPLNELSYLKGVVQRHRCQRLRTLIARMIAADIVKHRQCAEESD